MHIDINPQDGTPIYLLIANQVKYLVAAGRLQTDEEIPPIRALAEQLPLNPNTVAHAYLELERAGVVYKRPGTGTFVAEARSPLPRREKMKILTKYADTLLTEARRLGIPFADLLELLEERRDVMQPQVTP